MTDEHGVLRAIAWRDLCPWLMIFRTFGLSVRASILLLATVAVLLTPLGWNTAAYLLEPEKYHRGMLETVEINNSWPGQARSQGGDFQAPWSSLAWLHAHPVNQVFESVRLNMQAAFSTRGTIEDQVSFRKPAYFLVGGIWTVVVWAFFGGVITRIAAVDLGREERTTLTEAVTFTSRRFLSYLVGPISPLLVVLLFSFLTMVIGLFLKADLLVPIAGLLWIFALAFGFISAIVLLGLLVGWPLMWTTVSAEGTDAFDALSRAYAYSFQRPLHYLFYVVLAAAFGGLCWLVVSYVGYLTVEVSYWSAAWSAGESRVFDLRAYADGGPNSEALPWFGTSLMGLAVGLVRAVVHAFAYSFFWCAATATYLLLRRDVDQTEFDEIYLEDEEVRYGLPPLETDEAGVPGVPKSSTAENSDDGEDAASPSKENAESADSEDGQPS